MSAQNSDSHEIAKVLAFARHSDAEAPSADIVALIGKLADNSGIVENGYVLHEVNEHMRAALVINFELLGRRLPLLTHSDAKKDFTPDGILLKHDRHVWLGSFVDHVCRPDNLGLFHAIDPLVDLALGGLGVIQAIEFAKQANTPDTDELGLRRAVRNAEALLSTPYCHG